MDDPLVEFLEWFHQNGGQSPKLCFPVVFATGSRGAEAAENIRPNEIFLRVPERIIFNRAKCFALPGLGPVLEALPSEVSHDDDDILSLGLMHEKLRGEASFWMPYIGILPDPSTICTWTEEELGFLEDFTLQESAKNRKSRLRDKYQYLMQLLHQECEKRNLNLSILSSFDFELFWWAWRTIQARAFGRFVPWTALVPMADCLNHRNCSITYRFSDSIDHIPGKLITEYEIAAPPTYGDQTGTERSFIMMPTKSTTFSKGSEVFNSYGRRTNAHLLLEYGFCLVDNEWEVFDISLPSLADAFQDNIPPVHSEKILSLLNNIALQPGQTVRLFWNRFCDDLVVFYRVLHLTERDFSDGVAWAAWRRVISMDTELLALKACKRFLAKLLAKSSFSLCSDRAFHVEGEQNSVAQISATYRLTRKRMISQQIEWLDVIIVLVERMLAQTNTVSGAGKAHVPSRDPSASYLQSLVAAMTSAPPH